MDAPTEEELIDAWTEALADAVWPGSLKRAPFSTSSVAREVVTDIVRGQLPEVLGTRIAIVSQLEPEDEFADAFPRHVEDWRDAWFRVARPTHPHDVQRSQRIHRRPLP